MILVRVSDAFYRLACRDYMARLWSQYKVLATLRCSFRLQIAYRTRLFSRLFHSSFCFDNKTAWNCWQTQINQKYPAYMFLILRWQRPFESVVSSLKIVAVWNKFNGGKLSFNWCDFCRQSSRAGQSTNYRDAELTQCFFNSISNAETPGRSNAQARSTESSVDIRKLDRMKLFNFGGVIFP